MKQSPQNLGRDLFWTLASLKLAVITLLSIAAVLATGTVLESMHDADYARHYIYGTWWFAGLLLLLGMNVLFSALSRWPWKKHHIGFLVTHLGILILLSGALWTLLQGYEGQIIVAEGETASRMSLKQASLFFLDPMEQKFEEVPADFRFSKPELQSPFLAKVLGDVEVKVDQYYPHSAPEIRVQASEGMDNPALHVKISGSRAQVDDWLLAREYDRQRLSLGPASLSYVEIPDRAFFENILKDPQAFSGPIVSIDGQTFSVLSHLDKSFQVGEKKIRLEAFLPHAAVTEDGLKNLSSNPANPALKLSVETPRGPEGHTAFARFPELATLGSEVGWKPSQVRLFYFPTDLGKQNNEMILARTPEGKHLYSIKAGGKWGPIQVLDSRATFATGWMDFSFSLLEEVPKAEVEKIYRKVAMPETQEGPPPAIHLSLSHGGDSREYWLGRGDEIAVALGDKRLKMAFGLKNKPLGFEVKLNDFRMGTNEGTQDPSTYESQVTVLDPEGMRSSEHLIAMNQPLKYKKYKIFQASYQLNPGGPDWSVLAVAYDPGIFLKYTGAIVMVSGIILMFFFKPLFVQKKIAANKQNKEAELVLTTKPPLAN